MRRLRWTIAGCALCAAAGVGASGATDGSGDARRVRAAPVEAVVAGQALQLDAYAWRDFQPIAPPGGRPLRVRVRVVAGAGAALPDGLRIDGLWLVRGDALWALALRPAPPAGTVEMLGIDGPRLEPGTVVDVVARLRTADGAGHWLRAAGVAVRRTE